MSRRITTREPAAKRRFRLRGRRSRAENSDSGKRFRQTLMSRYMLIIFCAFCFVPVIFPLFSVLYLVISSQLSTPSDYLKYGTASDLETMWHREAAELAAGGPEAIKQRLYELKRLYPEASIFWVNAEGRTSLQLPEQAQLPVQWSVTDAIQFMKKNTYGDPFTVLAFIGQPDADYSGFMSIQMPRSIIQINSPIGSDTPYFIGFVFLMFMFFITLSLLFFRSIRRRLLRLQAAMAVQSDNGLPEPIVVTRQDEIGQLEESFNQMIEQLADSRGREQAETQLRKQLIANLSHDLRTPLTVMNSHVYTLRSEPLSEPAQAAVRQIEQKISSIGDLMDNLLTYTLMTSGRYPLKLEELDMLRLVRESAASWYPLWEQAGIVPDIELPEETVVWTLDKQGFRRILDNLFQNVVRHAQAGGHIAIAFAPREAGEPLAGSALVISDRGPGIQDEKAGKGAGIGLAIVDYLVQEMNLAIETHSSEQGTRFLIYTKR